MRVPGRAPTASEQEPPPRHAPRFEESEVAEEDHVDVGRSAGAMLEPQLHCDAALQDEERSAVGGGAAADVTSPCWPAARRDGRGGQTFV
jgi:hypothetical protein